MFSRKNVKWKRIVFYDNMLKRSGKVCNLRDDEKMFQWGFGMFAFAFVLIAVLQVAFRTQERARNRVRAEFVQAQQDFAEKQTAFSALVRPEVLRGTVAEMYPKFEAIGFKKNININEIKVKVISVSD